MRNRHPLYGRDHTHQRKRPVPPTDEDACGNCGRPIPDVCRCPWCGAGTCED